MQSMTFRSILKTFQFRILVKIKWLSMPVSDNWELLEKRVTISAMKLNHCILKFQGMKWLG